MSEYEAGEIVMLRSSGPMMTIVGPALESGERTIAMYTCVWFSEDGIVNYEDFYACTLTRRAPGGMR